MSSSRHIISRWAMAVFFLGSTQPANTSLTLETYTPGPIAYHNLVHGEALEYEAGWNGIPAAKATIVTECNPENCNLYNICAQAWTENLISKLWRMRDTVMTTMDAALFRPIRMILTQDENNEVSSRKVDFAYDEKSIKVRKEKNNDVTFEEFPLGLACDPVSAVFLFRSIDLHVGETIETDVCDGNGIFRLQVKVEAMENVKIGIGTFPAYRLNVAIEKIYPVSTDMEKKGKIKWVKLWVSADPTRILLLLKSKVFIGHVYIELISENRGMVASLNQIISSLNPRQCLPATPRDVQQCSR